MNTRSLFVLIFLTTLLSSCSLLKLSIDSGVSPLPQKELNSRLAVRSFYNELAENIVQASDSIYKQTEDINIKESTIKWKMRATSAATQSAFQTVPEIALLDTWIFCGQMNEFFQTQYADSIFQEYIIIPTEVSKNLEWKINHIAKAVYSFGEYRNRKKFVEEYVQDHPIQEMKFRRDNIMPNFTNYLGVSDTAYVKTVGSAPEVMTDLTERIGAYNKQIQNQVEWSKDLLLLDADVDSLSNEVFMRVDSLHFTMSEFVGFAKQSPETVQMLMDSLYTDWAPVIANLEGAVVKSFDEFATERLMFERFVDEQRKAAIEDLNRTSEHVIETTTNNLIVFVKKIAWVIILLLVVLTTIIVGLPLYIGYTIAKFKYKKKK